MPCSSWSCSVCGPAKAIKLGKEAKLAEPERWVTLTRAGRDPSECYGRLKTLSKALRRQGRGWEYLAAPEVDPNGLGGWHLHLLQKGSYIPQKELSKLARRAGMGRIVDIRRVEEDGRGVGLYLVKYMTKDERLRPPGSRRYNASHKFWGPDGRKGFKEKHKRLQASDWEVRKVPLGYFEDQGEVFSLAGRG